MIRKIALLILIFFTTTSLVKNGGTEMSMKLAYILFSEPENELLYADVWGTIYHPVTKQCDGTPTITGDGSRINPRKASEHRWIAISQEMLDCMYRANLVSSDGERFKGKIQYGDTIWIESPYESINGWWVVHDTKNKRYNNSIDFLQTMGDGSLYDNNPLWDGKFKDISIYRKKNNDYSELQKLAYL